eukprot:TRINITY_DN3791_c0_g1_i1.p1 TRINITY_DN3791_c0_g1~~TRINITY_DN3791_c0_g1_i1.p1  ORF type:complete len:109 (-),score=26.17 TRINITY_DN3791_c0_g1_i1:144-470(-)
MHQKILIVGAGDVGSVYGYYLNKAGYQVTYFVRPNRVDALEENGITLIDFANGKQRMHFADFDVVSTVEQVSECDTWAQVWLTVPSDAVHKPNNEWLVELLDAVRNNC